jgi:hypothetical protein
MPAHHSTLLGVTRGLLWLMLGLVVAAALLVLVVGIALVAAWPDVMVELRNSKVFIDPGIIQPQLLWMMAVLAGILAVAAFVLRQLQAMVASAATGDPFIPANAQRLRRIGCGLVAAQLLAIPLQMIASGIAASHSEFANMGGLSLNNILAILLAFVLAAVFEQGTAMRDELEGTV